MPTVTWARVDPARRAAVVEAAEAEFGVHGFSRGSLNVIARRAGVAKGSLFQYFADKRDLYAFIADIASQRVRAYMEERIRELDPSRPFFDFLTDWLDAWVAYFADHPHERALHAAATLEVDTEARVSVQNVIHRHYLEVLRPLVRDAHRPRRPTCGFRYRRADVPAAADLSASGAGALCARPGSDSRTRRAHPGATGTGGAPARRGTGRGIRRVAANAPNGDEGGHYMTRTHTGSMVAGGLNWDSLPLKLFAGGNAKFWNPADIDFSRDRADWERLSDDERHYATRLCAEFIAGEEAVTEDIQPFMSAMRAEGRLGDEMYLTQFAFEEAKHVQVFRMWLDAVGITDDLHEFLEDVPTYRTIFYEELPDCLNVLSVDPSPAAQIRASVTYNHMVEGMLALTGYFGWHKICVERGILPGMQELVRRIGDDERRHMAWGTFTCRRHVAADEANWDVFETRMNELMPLGLRLIEEGFALYDPMPFGLSVDEFMQYAADKGMRRFGTIASARGRPVAEIDLDYSPVQLEDTFADEDEKALAGV